MYYNEAVIGRSNFISIMPFLLLWMMTQIKKS